MFEKWLNRTKSVDKKTKELNGNPYIQAREEWDDRYGNMAKSIKNWQIAFAVMSIFALIMSITNARIATLSKIQPVLVETCEGSPTGFLPINGSKLQMDKVIKYSLDNFIINSRTIVGDAQAQKALLDKVYAYSADNTLMYLREYYEKNDPFIAASKYATQIKIIDTVPISSNTWQITFDETKKDAIDGEATSRWVATVTYRLGEVNPHFMVQNPFGIYITQMSWTELTK